MLKCLFPRAWKISEAGPRTQQKVFSHWKYTSKRFVRPQFLPFSFLISGHDVSSFDLPCVPAIMCCPILQPEAKKQYTLVIMDHNLHNCKLKQTLYLHKVILFSICYSTRKLTHYLFHILFFLNKFYIFNSIILYISWY